jgi:hypothetical protein
LLHGEIEHSAGRDRRAGAPIVISPPRNTNVVSDRVPRNEHFGISSSTAENVQVSRLSPLAPQMICAVPLAGSEPNAVSMYAAASATLTCCRVTENCSTFTALPRASGCASAARRNCASCTTCRPFSNTSCASVHVCSSVTPSFVSQTLFKEILIRFLRPSS